MKKQNSPGRNQNQQYQDDSFLHIGQKKQETKRVYKPTSKCQLPLKRRHINAYLLIISIALIAYLIFEFNQTYSLQQNQRAFANLSQKNLIIQEQNSAISKTLSTLNKKIEPADKNQDKKQALAATTSKSIEQKPINNQLNQQLTNNKQKKQQEKTNKQQIKNQQSEKQKSQRQQAYIKKIFKQKAEQQRQMIQKQLAKLKNNQLQKAQGQKAQQQKLYLTAEQQKFILQLAQKQRLNKQKAEKQRIDQQRTEKQRLENQNAEKKRLVQQKAKKQMQERQKANRQQLQKIKAKQTNKPKQPVWPKSNLTKQQYLFAVRRMELKNENITGTTPLADQQRKYFEQKYHLSKYTKELPICIVVPSYNNVVENRHFQNMRSILMQQYKNYHIVFIDDASQDKTGQQIAEFMKNQTILPPERYNIIINKQQRLAMPNIRMAAKDYCKPEQIFIIVDGDDELLGRQVLRLYNAIFQEKKVWFMYTNYLPKDGYVGYSQEIPAEIIESGKYREYKYCTSHLRAFYTKLFTNVKDADLQDDLGNFLRAANDVAIIFPIMEQAHERVIYVPEYVYYYNDNTGMNNRLIRKPQQLGNEKMLRNRKRYKRLDDLMSPLQ